jgi:hypothetical protein
MVAEDEFEAGAHLFDGVEGAPEGTQTLGGDSIETARAPCVGAGGFGSGREEALALEAIQRDVHRATLDGATRPPLDIRADRRGIRRGVGEAKNCEEDEDFELAEECRHDANNVGVLSCDVNNVGR